MTKKKEDDYSHEIIPISEIVMDPNNIVAFDQAEQKLVALEKHVNSLVLDYTTKQGIKDAQATLTSLVSHRTGIDKRRVAAKKPSLDYGKNLDAYAKKLVARVAKLEAPIKKQLDEIKRKEEIRLEEHRVTLKLLSTIAQQPWDITSHGLIDVLVKLDTIVLEELEEFEEEGRKRYLIAKSDLQRQLTAKTQAEQAAEDQKKKDDELAELKKQLEEKDAENKRLEEQEEKNRKQQEEMAELKKKMEEANAAKGAEKKAAAEVAEVIDESPGGGVAYVEEMSDKEMRHYGGIPFTTKPLDEMSDKELFDSFDPGPSTGTHELPTSNEQVIKHKAIFAKIMDVALVEPPDAFQITSSILAGEFPYIKITDT